jgi:RNA-dependent RNA polymerase
MSVVVNTDTESSLPSTRQNSLLSFPESTNTSMTSIWSDVSAPSSRKRSIEYPDASAPSTSPKIRRTTEGPQRAGPPTISRAATFPTIKPQSMYPPLDEESVFRVISEKPATAKSPSPQTSGPAMPYASSSKTSSVTTPPSVISKSLPSTPAVILNPRDSSSDSISCEISKHFNFVNVAQSTFYLIAHDGNIQKLMDDKRLSRGVQFEIARGESQGIWQWRDVTPEKLHLLGGSNAESAWKVPT